MSDYLYYAEAMLDDDSVVKVDLEEHGWADKEFLSKVRRWALLPYEMGPERAVVVVNIPEGGKPIFKSRVYGRIDGIGFRCYAVGYHEHGRSHWTWVMPNGFIEVGEEPIMADKLMEEMKLVQAQEQK